MNIGQIIKYYRGLHHLTQNELAELSGINEKYLGRMERDESVPTLEKIEQLCVAFDIRISDLLMINIKQLSENKMIHYDTNNEKRKKIVYYCNCCGCTFESETINSILCPNCMCEYDEENGFIEKNEIFE